MFAQKPIYKRSDGDLLTGTWKCSRCKDTTVQTINFRDTVFTRTRISEEGIQSDTCAYRVRRNKLFIECDKGKKTTRYRIVLIDIHNLELKQWNQKSEEFKKSL
ncbi:MAG: hypothetical protein K0Q95_1204 [Bacteroidota bacterium]|jgi:hypothetical protein|nr:hypothetical protein [Bacteroidota bacterium]